MNKYYISIYQDKRNKKVSGLYPVKIRIYSSLVKKKKMYSTGVDLSEKDFKKITSNEKLRGKNREYRITLNKINYNVNEIAKGLEPFTFEAFERKFLRNRNAAINVSHHYKIKIELLLKNEQVSTASNYDLSLKSINIFLNAKFRIKPENLNFYDITNNWLEQYERFMVIENNKSHTTVSMYLRALRSIFNDAISINDIKHDIYPFGKGKGKYQIPSATKKKKALSKKQLGILFNATPKTAEQEFAKNIWFFSYACSGMNMKDIALLKYENLKDDSLVYYRAKTINTKKGNLKQINIFLNEYAKNIIEKYGNKNKSTKQIIFPIIKNVDDAVEQQRKIKNFTSTVNLHFNKFAKNLGFEFKISTYWARHSFATNAIRKGASMEFISEALNHSNLNVTKSYFAGFEDETKKEFANTLMDF